MSSTFMRFQKDDGVVFVAIDDIGAISRPHADSDTGTYRHDGTLIGVTYLHPDEIMRDMAKIVKEEP